MATFLRTWSTYWIASGTGTPNSVSDMCGYISVSLESQSIANNTSTISITHYARMYGGTSQTGSGTVTSSYRANNGSYGGSYQSKSGGPYIVYTGDGYKLFNMGTTTHTVTHNADGTAQLYVNGSFDAPAWYGGTTKTSSFNTALPTIPRYATINSFTFDKASGAAGLSRLTCNWSVSNTCDAVEYSLSGGGWTSSGTSGTSGSFNISGLTPNIQYSLRIRVKRTDSQLWMESGTLYATTYDIAKITAAPNNNVNMDNTQTITYTNPSGASLQISLYKTDGATTIAGYRACSGTSYPFTFEPGEKTAFYNEIPTTKTLPLRFYLTTSDGLGNTYYNYVERTFEVFNANPTFTTWTYADTNAATIALTGSNQKIIKGYSNVKATITSANKMVAIKGATATSYQLTIGAKNATANYSADSTVEMTINAVDNNVFNCYAIDGRNNSTNVIKTLTTDYINYTPISITSATATRTNDIGTETTLAFSGNIFDGSFGSVSNSVKTATYKFKKTTDVSYTNGTSVITPTKTGGAFSFSGTIKGDEGSGGVNGFDATYSYNVQVIITDELSTHTFNFVLGSGKPNIAIHQDGVAINQAYDETLGGALQVKGPITYQPENLNDLDCNNLIGRVITGYGNNMTNKPPISNNGYFENIPHSGNPTNYNMQRYIDRPFLGMWTRNMENGVWGTWTKILTTGDAVILYTNGNPTSSLGSATLTLSANISGFDSYEVLYKYYMGDSQLCSSGIIPKSFGTKLNSSYEYAAVREVGAPSGTSVVVQDARIMNTIGTTSTDSKRCVPIYIVGHNTGLF